MRTDMKGLTEKDKRFRRQLLGRWCDVLTAEMRSQQQMVDPVGLILDLRDSEAMLCAVALNMLMGATQEQAEQKLAEAVLECDKKDVPTVTCVISMQVCKAWFSKFVDFEGNLGKRPHGSHLIMCVASGGNSYAYVVLEQPPQHCQQRIIPWWTRLK